MIELIVVEDVALMRETLTRCINDVEGIHVQAAYPDADFVAKIALDRLNCDVILMDICTKSRMTGIDATKYIKERRPEIKIIVTTAYEDVTFVGRAKEAGADSFVYKSVEYSELIQTIIRTVSGEKVFPEIQSKVRIDDDVEFTDKEVEVLCLVCKALTRRQIAGELGVSENTIKFHLDNLMRKTGMNSTAKLAIYAVKKGLINPEANN